MRPDPAYARESDLCAAFIDALPDEWTAYPETGGFDILLVRPADGFQIGVEAKLKLNAKVISQAAEKLSTWAIDSAGPDCRAVLIPEGVGMDLKEICRMVNVTPIVMYNPVSEKRRYRSNLFTPSLPDTKHSWSGDGWYELAPTKRLPIPDWIPDVTAGSSAPQQLSFWKVAAIKIVVTLEKRGYVTRQDFAHHKISMSRWTQMRWIVKDAAAKGCWVASDLPDFRSQHPINFPQIENDYEKWKCPAGECSARQEALL